MMRRGTVEEDAGLAKMPTKALGRLALAGYTFTAVA